MSPRIDPFREEDESLEDEFSSPPSGAGRCGECGKKYCICEERDEMEGLEPDEELDFSHGN